MTVREYLLGVTAAALFCGIVRILLPGKGTVAAVVRVLLGVTMMLAVLRPWASVRLDGLFEWSNGIQTDAQSIVADAENSALQTLRTRIKQDCEAYILAKAESLGAQIEVSVEVSEDTPPAPIMVTLSGAVSPYAKQTLSSMLSEELGIHREGQQWVG